MDLAMVKHEQGETLRKYMRRFFDKRATVVDVTDKEVMDLFQDGLYHRRTFEDFGRRHPSSITHLKDMITSWVDEEENANAKYDAISGKSKQNTGGNNNNNNNRDQGGRSSNYSGPNRKCKPNNTITAIQRPAKDGLYHHRTFEDFGRRHSSSITKLKDMITSWADEEDKANTKYDAIRGKSKQNPSGSNNNNRCQGGHNNYYSGPNRKHKLDNTVAAIQSRTKDNSKNTFGGFKDLLKEKCPWHLEGNHTSEQCYQLWQAFKDSLDPQPPHDKKGKKKVDVGNGDFQESTRW
jgi:hypothetical protein